MGKIVLAAAALAALAAPPAAAHGPTVVASFGAFRPGQITIAAGDTVHFRRASGSQVTLTLVSDSGLFESPTLDAAGWHHTFDRPGDYSFHLKENSGVSLRVLVGEPRAEPVEDPHAGHDH